MDRAPFILCVGVNNSSEARNRSSLLQMGKHHDVVAIILQRAAAETCTVCKPIPES